jgi:uncharacterized protein (TIGR02996 family)
MTDREALLRAVAANPDDDTPRLIYADCLDEIGGEANVARARFIRLQIDIHRTPAASGGTEAFEQKVTEAGALAAQFGKLWLEELPLWAKATPARWGLDGNLFSRGFVERVLVLPGSFNSRWDSFLDTTPVTRGAVRKAQPTHRHTQVLSALKTPELDSQIL